MTTIKLSSLMEAIELGNDEGIEYFIHFKTGCIILVTEDILSIAKSEDKEELQTWQLELVAGIQDYLDNLDDYIQAPSQRDVNEYEMREDFVKSLKSEKYQQQLLSAI